MEIVITMVSLANLQMQSCRCDDVENILMPSQWISPSNRGLVDEQQHICDPETGGPPLVTAGGLLI